jgi:hypothetical protein
VKGQRNNDISLTLKKGVYIILYRTA